MDAWSLGSAISVRPTQINFLYSKPFFGLKLFIRTQTERILLGSGWHCNAYASRHAGNSDLGIGPRGCTWKRDPDTWSRRLSGFAKRGLSDGQVYSGSQWRDSADPTRLYENDLPAIVDTTAIIIEAKAHLVDPPARRGAVIIYLWIRSKIRSCRLQSRRGDLSSSYERIQRSMSFREETGESTRFGPSQCPTPAASCVKNS